MYSLLLMASFLKIIRKTYVGIIAFTGVAGVVGVVYVPVTNIY